MSAGIPEERNNNDVITSFDVTETRTAGPVMANTLWVKLTPQVLKAIILVLVTAIVVCVTVTAAIVVTQMMQVSGKPSVMNTTVSTPTTSSTPSSTSTITTSSSSTSTTSMSSTTTMSSTSSTTTESSSSSSSSPLSPSSSSSTTTAATNSTTPESSSTSSSTSSSSTTMSSSSTISSSSSTTTNTSSTTSAPVLSPSSSTAASVPSSTSTSSTTTSTTTSTTESPTTTEASTTTTAVTSTTVPECLQTQFPCGSGECIPWKNLCDGFPQCRDGSDEGVDCVCGSDQWRCNSGQCVPAEARCNQEVDCHDSSDEMLCPDCSGFQCDTGLCLWDSNERRCNGVFDCADLSDEMGCTNRAGTRLCNNTVLVLQSQWCDGLDDCGDNSDEADCTRACRGFRMACPDGQCIMKAWRCDGYADCQDGYDEVGCGTCLSTEFMCDNYQCVGEAAVCDGVWDCKTGEDELHCFSAQEENSGELWARFQGQDYPVCSDQWSTDFAVQICTDIDQLQLSSWKEVAPSESMTRFVAFNNNTLSAHTTNLAIRDKCRSGRVIHITCHKEECGNRKVAFLQSFVAGGQIVSPGKWPWMVSLLHLGKFICGGTLISQRWAVTAAHCILNSFKGDYNATSTPFYFDLIVGSTHRMGQSQLGTPYRIRVDRILLYPNLTRPLQGGVDWDLALLRLSVPVGWTDYIQPACLPHQGQSTALTSLCYLAGWGLMNPQQVLSPENLRDTRMQLWSDTRCRTNTIPGESTVNTNSTLCGGFVFGKPSSCQGDSGGPLMCLASNNRWVLVGLTSRGSAPCGKYHPTIKANRFARVANVVDWIRQETSEN